MHSVSLDVFANEQRFQALMMELTQRNCEFVEKKRDAAKEQRKNKFSRSFTPIALKWIFHCPGCVN